MASLWLKESIAEEKADTIERLNAERDHGQVDGKPGRNILIVLMAGLGLIVFTADLFLSTGVATGASYTAILRETLTISSTDEPGASLAPLRKSL